MDNETAALHFFQQIIQKVTDLEKELADTKQDLRSAQQDNTAKDAKIEALNRYVADLRNLIQTFNREIYVLENELEHYRGF